MVAAMNKHIEGPWMLHDMEAFTVVTEKKPGRFIALCDGKENTEEENEAHTCLVIASLDILKALELILPLAKGYAPEGQTDTAKKTCQSWIDVAEEAVTKAKGGRND